MKMVMNFVSRSCKYVNEMMNKKKKRDSAGVGKRDDEGKDSLI